MPLPGAGVSREVPCSALKGETVPDSLPADELEESGAGEPHISLHSRQMLPGLVKELELCPAGLLPALRTPSPDPIP